MANTYSQLYTHIVFAVKEIRNFVKDPFREELQKYISGIITIKKQKLYAIYCMPDHTHILVSMKPDLAVSDLVRVIKSNSSTFIKGKNFAGNFAWQNGFCAFSCSKSHALNVMNYILNQPEHYKKKTFRHEYHQLMDKYEIDYDEKYLFEFYDE